MLDLDRYTVAYLVWTANKLSRGASHNYLKVFGVGVETWRCLVLLAIHNSIAAQQISQVMGMDKASVSRCFKIMQAKGLILMGLDASDGRVRIATLTPKGRALHDQILEMALERERVLLSVLSESDRETLLRLLKRVHENLAGRRDGHGRLRRQALPARRAAPSRNGQRSGSRPTSPPVISSDRDRRNGSGGSGDTQAASVTQSWCTLVMSGRGRRLC